MDKTKETRSDRREKARFPIHSELRYKVLQDSTVLEAGTGLTENISSGGLLFSRAQALKPGCFVELSIAWPVLLNESCPMRLIAFGRVLRSADGITACTIDKYEFRTQARVTVRPLEFHRSDSMLVRWAAGVRKESMKANLATAG